MRKLPILAFIFLITIASALADTMQTINDSNVYISALSERKGSGYVPIDLVPKFGSANITIALGFDLKNTNPKSLEMYIGTYNRTLGNGSLEFTENWTSLSPSISVNYNFDGKSKWYIFDNFPVVKDRRYIMRMYLEVLDSGKYDIAMKLSSDSFANAVANNRFYFLDPTYGQPSKVNYSAYAYSSTAPAPPANMIDGNYANYWQGASQDSIFWFGWKRNDSSTFNVNQTRFLSYDNGGYRLINYTIMASPNSTNGVDGNWVWLCNVTNNVLQNRTDDFVNVNYYKFYKYNVTARGAPIGGGGEAINEIDWQGFLDLNGTAPNGTISVNFNEQIPINITASNLLNDDLNVSFNVSSGGNMTNMVLFFNTTHNNGVFSYIYTANNFTLMNFSLVPSYNISNNLSGIFHWLLHHDYIYPTRTNYNISYMENSNKLNASIGAANGWIIERYYNVSPAREFNYLLLGVFNASGLPLPIFFCNSSYSTGNPATDANCANFYTLLPHPYDAVDKNDSYFIIPMPVINGSILGRYVTNPSYFAYQGGNGWSFNYVSRCVYNDTLRTSSNNGNLWSNFSGCATMFSHLHQMVDQSIQNMSTFSYYACLMNGTIPQVCSAPKTEPFGTLILPPSAPHVISPSAGTYNGTILINYTQAISETGQILYYSIDLYDSAFSFVQSIVANNSLNLTYRWNTTAASNGNYYIFVTAFDNQSLSSSDLSELFTISNPIVVPPATTADALTNATNSFSLIFSLLFAGVLYFLYFIMKKIHKELSGILIFIAIIFVVIAIKYSSDSFIKFVLTLVLLLFFITFMFDLIGDDG